MNLHAQEDHMKWGRFYFWSTVIGSMLGGIPAIYYLFFSLGDPIKEFDETLTADGWLPVGFMRWTLAAIVLLAFALGAMCGTALAALHHVIYAIYFYFCHRSAPSRRMSLSDEERRAFEKELKQAEAEGKEG